MVTPLPNQDAKGFTRESDMPELQLDTDSEYEPSMNSLKCIRKSNILSYNRVTWSGQLNILGNLSNQESSKWYAGRNKHQIQPIQTFLKTDQFIIQVIGARTKHLQQRLLRHGHCVRGSLLAAAMIHEWIAESTCDQSCYAWSHMQKTYLWNIIMFVRQVILSGITLGPHVNQLVTKLYPLAKSSLMTQLCHHYWDVKNHQQCA